MIVKWYPSKVLAWIESINMDKDRSQRNIEVKESFVVFYLW